MSPQFELPDHKFLPIEFHRFIATNFYFLFKYVKNQAKIKDRLKTLMLKFCQKTVYSCELIYETFIPDIRRIRKSHIFGPPTHLVHDVVIE